MGKDDDDDIVQLPSAWTITHRRVRREIQLEGVWDAHAKPYHNAFGQPLSWLEHMKKGAWAMEDWVVEGLFLEGHIGLLVGDAGTGKSLAALDLMIAAVSGGKWLGHFECTTSPVVYLAGEGKVDENTAHMLGLLMGRGEDIPTFLQRCGARVQLITPSNAKITADAPLSSDAWWENTKALVESTYPKEARPKLWIFDPLLALMNSTDKADDVRPFIARCRWLAEQTGGYVLLVHHTKKSQGGQLSRREKIRGESMWVNLCDDVLCMEQDQDDPKLAHLYANKLKRGASDDTKPLCHIARAFNTVTEATFREVLKYTGVPCTGEESPSSLKQIVLRYLPYSAELHRPERDEAPVPDDVAPKPKAAKKTLTAKQEGPDMSAWDEDHKRVWHALFISSEPLSTLKLQQALLVDGGQPASVSKIQTRLDTLEAQDLIVRVPTEPGVGRPGVRYLLKTRSA